MEGFFSRSELLLGADACARLARSHVWIFGLGGVGSWCTEALARTGVGRLTLVDFDRVSPSNVNRQLPAAAGTVGRPKAEVMRERLAATVPGLAACARVERFGADTAADFDLAGADCVIDAIDDVAAKRLLIASALALAPEVALVSSMGAASRTDPARIRRGSFRKVQGDGLARALRRRFRAEGGAVPDFQCVWSDEVPDPAAVGADGERGSIVTVTAAFGLQLAAAAIARLTA